MESIKGKIVLKLADITKLEVGAIVNAANETLMGGGGVDGAIHRAAGPRLLEECRQLNGCETGDAKITKGYNLPAKHVIHTVGPFGKHPKLLESCYKKSLDLLKENNLRTIAFPCISTGIYRYPNQDAAEVAFKTVHNWIKNNPDSIDEAIFCLFLNVDVKIYEQLHSRYFPDNGGSSVDGEDYGKHKKEKVKSDSERKKEKKDEKSSKSFHLPFLGSKKGKKGKETVSESKSSKVSQSSNPDHTADYKDPHYRTQEPMAHDDKEGDLQNTKLKEKNTKGKNSEGHKLSDRGEEEMEVTKNPPKRVKGDATGGDQKRSDDPQQTTELEDNLPESDKNYTGSNAGTKEKH